MCVCVRACVYTHTRLEDNVQKLVLLPCDSLELNSGRRAWQRSCWTCPHILVFRNTRCLATVLKTLWQGVWIAIPIFLPRISNYIHLSPGNSILSLTLGEVCSRPRWNQCLVNIPGQGGRGTPKLCTRLTVLALGSRKSKPPSVLKCIIS